MPRLPAAQLTLPGPYRIRVSYRSDKQIKAAMGKDCYGYWEIGKSGGRIVLNSDVPHWRNLKTFGHELVHAVNDYAHFLDLSADTERLEAERTVRELAEDD